MTERVKFLVVRSRQGWAVNAGSDRLSDHVDLEEARQEAAHRAELSRDAGDEADSIDLSDDDPQA